ncbi:MAG: FUSC family protein [Solirubrobacterales bacterium]|nr:FUSC family protein [Solirubrobacterales bacterium]
MLAARSLAKATSVDHTRASLRIGLIAALPVVVMLALGTTFFKPDQAVLLGVGAMLVGVAWRAQGPANPPLGTMSAAALMLALSTFVGSLTGRWPWLHLAVLFCFCLAAGLATAIGRRGTVTGNHALIAFVVFGRFPESPANALGLTGLVLIGACAQLIGATLLAAPLAWRRQRNALASAYEHLAELGEGLTKSLQTAAVALEDADRALAAPALFADPQLSGLVSLVAEGRRIRLELVALAAALAHTEREHPELAARARPELEHGLALLEQTLEAIARGFRDGAQSRRADSEAMIRARSQALKAWAEARDDLPAPVLENHLAALGAQVRAAARLAITVLNSDDRHWAAARPSLGSSQRVSGYLDDLQQIRNGISLKTAPGRHALRLAVVVAGTELLVQRLGLPRGYWAVVGAATVLRPEFGATVTRGAERVAGALGGVVIATLISVLLNPQGWGVAAVVGVLATFTYATYPASFAIGTAGMTAMVVFMLHVVSPDSVAIAFDRGLDTVIGGAIGLGAYMLWPTWSRDSLLVRIGLLIDAQRSYLQAVLASLLDGRPGDATLLRPLARRARTAFADAQTSLTVAQGEPGRTGYGHEEAAATLAALRRVAHAIHALRRAGDEPPAPRTELRELGDGTLQALSAIRARTAGEDAQLPPLRKLYRHAGTQHPDAVRVALDELVDAIDATAATLSSEPTAKP